MIKAVLLDFGGVLFVDKETFDGPTGDLSNNPNLWKQARVGKADDSAVFQDIADKFDTNIDTVKSWFFSRREPNQELLALLDELKAHLKVGIVNNGLRTLFYGYLETYGLIDRFDALIQSAEVGVEKPDRRIYMLACKQLEVLPEECIFVDDNELNVEGAKKAGMQAININDKNLRKVFSDLQLLK